MTTEIKAGVTYKVKNGDEYTLYHKYDFVVMARKILKAERRDDNDIDDIINKIMSRYDGGNTYFWGINHDAKCFTFQNYDCNGQALDGDGNVNHYSGIAIIVEGDIKNKIKVGNTYKNKRGGEYIIYDRAGFVGEMFRRKVANREIEQRALKDIGTILLSFNEINYFGIKADGSTAYLVYDKFGVSQTFNGTCWDLIVE